MLYKRNLLSLLFCLCLFVLSGWSQVNIFTEDFQSGIPSSWGLRNFDGLTPDASVAEYASAWISKVDIDSSANLTASSTSFFSPAGIANRWLISPGITLGFYGNILTWRARSHDASFPDNYIVLVSKTDTAKASFTDTLGYIIGEYVDWTNRSANLSNLGVDNETIYLAFVLQTNDGYKLYIDDIEVTKEDPLGLSENIGEYLEVVTIENGLYSLKGNFELIETKVFNSLGQLIVIEKNNELDIKRENSGIYFIQVNTSKGLINKTLIKF
jgi:hypothetical protein